MSIGNVRALDWRNIAAFISAAIFVVAGVSCIVRRGDDQPNGDLDKYFLRDVAKAQAMGVPVYWLGREFTAGGLVFRGPYTAEFGAEVPGGIQLTYLAPSQGAGQTSVDLSVQGRDAWELAKERITNPRTPGASRRSVTVLGKDAEMFSVPGGTRPLNALWLVLDLGDAVVVASVNSGGPIYPGGPDYSPFINNPDLLVQVIEENLRPYPE
jgi:hypothetical protein